jgi:ADP-heptose:LPS heptosyltransferase
MAAFISKHSVTGIAKASAASSIASVSNAGTAGNGTANHPDFRRIIIHPGTSRLAVQKGIIKTWSTDNWVALISKLQQSPNIEIILAGGPDDEAIIKEISAKVTPSANLLSAVGHTKSLADLAALIDVSSILVCVDSAPMHLAVALDKPLVALFGPTDEAKLLPPSRIFKALRDRPTSEFPRQLVDGLGVLLQPDTVYQSLMDLSKELTDQGSRQIELR